MAITITEIIQYFDYLFSKKGNTVFKIRHKLSNQ